MIALARRRKTQAPPASLRARQDLRRSPRPLFREAFLYLRVVNPRPAVKRGDKLYDLKADGAKVLRLSNGRYETTLIVEAKKAYADGQGRERAAPLRKPINVGLFTEQPGDGAFHRSKVFYLERRPFSSGRQEIRIVTRERPVHAGIDPYNTFIDRNSDDNLVETT